MLILQQTGHIFIPASQSDLTLEILKTAFQLKS